VELLDSSRSIVTVIDLQGKLMEMAYRSSMGFARRFRLLRLAELFRVPVVLTEQYPRGSASPIRACGRSSTGSPCEGNDEEYVVSGAAGIRVRGAARPGRPGCRRKRRQIASRIEAGVCVMQTGSSCCAVATR